VFWFVFSTAPRGGSAAGEPFRFSDFPDMLNEPQRRVRAGSLGINGADNRLATSDQAPGWRFHGLDCFYFRASGP
jgi:hypothetical protein